VTEPWITPSTRRSPFNVHQVVRDLAGQVKADRVVQHVYELRDELIVSMEIRTHA
jgi:hypothetical protein